MKVRTINLRGAAAMLALGALVAGCGAAPTDTGGAGGGKSGDLQAVYKAVNGLTGKQRYDKLLALAKKVNGGTVGFYHPGDEKPEVEAFEKQTGLKVNDFQATSERVMERVTQEDKAGQQGSDVVLGGSDDMKALNDQKGLAKLQTPTFAWEGNKGFATAYDISPIGIMEMPTYNTDKVSADKLPKTWEQLFQHPPGRLGIEITDQAWYEVLIKKYFEKQKHMSEAAAIKLITGGFKGAQQVDGHTLVANLLASGQYAYVPDLFAHYVPGLKKSGAPISYDNLSPSMPPVLTTLSLGLTEGAKNPAGGLLFLEWMMAKEGQKQIAGQDYVPLSTQYTGQTLYKKYPNAIFNDLWKTDSAQETDAWKSKFQKLLQSIGGKPKTQ